MINMTTATILQTVNTICIREAHLTLAEFTNKITPAMKENKQVQVIYYTRTGVTIRRNQCGEGNSSKSRQKLLRKSNSVSDHSPLQSTNLFDLSLPPPTPTPPGKGSHVNWDAIEKDSSYPDEVCDWRTKQ